MSYNVWIETEEVDEDGDQIQEIDTHCQKLVHCDSMEEVDKVFSCASNNHIAFGWLKKFCELAEESDDPQLKQLRHAARHGLRMVGLAHMVD